MEFLGYLLFLLNRFPTDRTDFQGADKHMEVLMSKNYRRKRTRQSGRASFLVMSGVLAVAAILIVASKYIARPQDKQDVDQGAQSSSQSGTISGDASSSQLNQNSGNEDHKNEENGKEDGSSQASSSAPVPPKDEGSNPEPPAQKGTGYDFSQPAPASAAVENSYFDDAAFVGDSRTDGFMIYSGIGTGKNLTSNGLSIFKLDEKKALTIGGTQYTLMEALALEQYGKVYLSLGINELGYFDDQGFYDNYCKAIDQIRQLQPNAVIYMQGLIPLNESQAAKSTGQTYFKNDHLRIYNDLMRKAAEEKEVVFLDLYSEFADENGSLPADASKDGIHLYQEYCKRWLEYLKTHTVDYKTLYEN